MTKTIITSQGQTTVPINIRQILGVNPGGSIVWQAKRNFKGLPRIEISAASIKTLKALRGVGTETYAQVGGGAQHLQSERNNWD